jgi:hypothetical protein
MSDIFIVVGAKMAGFSYMKSNFKIGKINQFKNLKDISGKCGAFIHEINALYTMQDYLEIVW